MCWRIPVCAYGNTRSNHSRGAINIYRLRDELRATILVACTKCDWKAAYSRDELMALHCADRAMPDLLNYLAAPGCSKVGSNWDRCGAHFVEPIEGVARALIDLCQDLTIPVAVPISCAGSGR